ncbi:MAG: hypothetical protein KIS67_17455 [Verrucomicrobiae bacterium]|nr:hypothetical protein [Verrucomicrobiae bacterium]
MLRLTAVKMMGHEPIRYAGAGFGISLALFLVFLQSGFYFGFKRDITVVQDSFDADLWIAPQALLSFDYAVHLDDAAYWQARNVPGVASAARVVFDWSKWRIPGTGAKESVQVLGIEFDEGIRFDFGVPFENAGALLRPDGHVLVDEKAAAKLGVKVPHFASRSELLNRSNRRESALTSPEERWSGLTSAATEFTASQPRAEVEIHGRRAKVVGFVRGKKLFSTSCLVVTDFDNARRFLGLPAQHVSFVAVRCQAGADVDQVAGRLQEALPEHDVFTARALHDLTQHYWESRTGIGPILFLSAGLAALVGFLTVLLTFYLLTVQKLPVFAALKALGASGSEIAAVIGLQAGVMFVAGSLVAGIALAAALAALARTTISVVISPTTALAVLGLIALASALACVPALWKVVHLEPAEAFRA